MERIDANGFVRGKYVIMTGATSGIGLAAAKELAFRGANLGIVARNEAKAKEAAARIKAAAGSSATVDIFMADMASQQSIRKAAADILERWPQIHILVNNAGAMFIERRLTADDIEMTWAVNHLAPFLLTNLLLDRLKECGRGRIITTASHGHRMAGKGIRFDDLGAEKLYRFPGNVLGGANLRYGETKLANIMFTNELGRKLEGTGLTAACFDPGLVSTNFNQDNGRLARMTMAVMKWFSRSPEKGAETLVWLADEEKITVSDGSYFKDRQSVKPSGHALDQDAAGRLWEISEKQLR
ncbi:SDR family NAD(P)-dependent oxidoreductase [Paenibacillus piri]|uniref:SDR family NAD(P)-dependent oxidoreductase n=1 Tax=Paenibacillus piri TaxID=2547395 RepID=A0A4V2ZSX7_9BACL|nr:SDR family NAD(P)-dependent oxidoreductase [Paenibacillus piri]TDF94814.1 SDR family NAD(P)-dependent oxidoreductase [Paenibacillus piri]